MKNTSVKTQANALLAGVGAVALASYPWAAGSVAVNLVHHAALAATIGGLADWWGVTAIFARPLGMAAPGTDMLRERYDELKAALVDFVCEDVLAPANVMQVLGEESLAQVLTAHFSEREHVMEAWSVVQPLAEEVLRRLNTAECEQLLLNEVPRYLPSLKLPDILLDVAQRAVANGQTDGIWKLLAAQGRRLLEGAEFKAFLQDMARRADLHYTQDSFLRDLFVGGLLEDNVPEKFTQFLQERLGELTDAGSELRRTIDNWLLAKLEELRRDIALRNWVNDKAAQLVTSQALALREELRQADAAWLLALAEEKLAELAASEAQQAQLDAALKRFLQSVLENNQDVLRALIAKELDKFSADNVVQTLEERTGDDMQNIRISGTLIGGLLGAVLFIVELIAERLVG